MSVRSDAAVCKRCGLVELASKMVRVEDGEYVYACQGCAAAQRVADAPGGRDASRAAPARGRRG